MAVKITHIHCTQKYNNDDNKNNKHINFELYKCSISTVASRNLNTSSITHILNLLVVVSIPTIAHLRCDRKNVLRKSTA